VKRGEQKTNSILVFIKNLVRILQNRIHDANLPRSIRNIASRGRAHERRPEDDGQVLRAHAVDGAVIHDPMQMQRERAQGGIVGVGQIVDDGVHTVSPHDVVVMFCRFDKRRIVLGREEGIREIAEELLQQTGNTIDVVEEVLRVSKVQDMRFLIC
jgi:uncharacterized protein (UPF0147 family)